MIVPRCFRSAPPLPALLILLAGSLLCGPARAASIHVIPRTDAEALVPVIRPLLDDDGYVNAYQGKLIIRTGDANFARIQDVLGQMSDHPRTVTVYLRRNGGSSQQGSGLHVDQRGVTVTTGSRHHQSQQTYTINTLSGHAAGISQGSLVAVAGGYYPALVSLQQGISVTPQVTANGQVRLSIEQRFDQPAGGGRATLQDASSTLMLTPGQWQPLGSIAISERTDSAGLNGAATDSRRMNLPLEVKVELQ